MAEGLVRPDWKAKRKILQLITSADHILKFWRAINKTVRDQPVKHPHAAIR